jgi:outer membrane receptor for ferrienterochelin and colicins
MINGGRNLFQGYDVIDTSRNIQWNPKEQYFANFQAIQKFGDHSIRLSSMFFDEFILNRGSLRPPYFESAFDDKYKTRRLTNSLFFKGKLGEEKYYDIIASYSYFNRKKNTFFKDMLTLDERLTENESDQDTSIFDLINIRATYSDDFLNHYLKYQAGTDINIESANGDKILDNEQSVTDIAGFLSVQFVPTETITVQPSVRIIYNSQYEAPLVPAVNFRYQMNKNLLLRASYAKGFRAPSLRELYLLFVDINHNIYGNENLKAETSDSYNFSTILSMNSDKYYFKLEPKLFYNKIYDMITLANIEGDLYQNINIGSFESIGGNFTLQYMRENINFKTTISYIGRSNNLDEEFETSRFNFSPELIINFDYNFPFIDTKLKSII